MMNAGFGGLFVFMVPVERASSSLPTFLNVHDAEHNRGPSLTRSAQQLLKYPDLHHWTRYPATLNMSVLPES